MRNLRYKCPIGSTILLTVVFNRKILIIHVLIQDELGTFRMKAEDLEKKLIEVQKHSDKLSQETQERDSKINQLQEMLARY